MTVETRAFREADAAALRALWIEVWSSLFPQIDFAARWPAMLAQWQRIGAAGGPFITALRDGEPRGFMVVDIKLAYLDQLGVARGEQGSGLATHLLALAKALPLASLDLHVNADNSRAIRFYEREGFRRVGEATNRTSGLPTYRYRWERSAQRQSDAHDMTPSSP